MTGWEKLLSSALVGTERQAPDLAAPDGTGVLDGIDPSDPERALLAGAAALATWRRAGFRPGTRPGSGPEPAPPETRPRCGALAANRLRLLLSGGDRDLLAEWLAAVRKAGLRVPEAELPELLQLGAIHAELREAVLAVTGERGRWLAAQNPVWAYAVAAPEDPGAAWETGNREARIAVLRRLRSAEPAAARELLLTGWEKEKPSDRAVFIDELLTGLSPADEPFLERCLDDRRKEVRTSAAEVLSHLPSSQLVARMLERVQPLLTLQRRFLSQSLEVSLPEAHDDAMARDGIEPKPQGVVMGERAWWLLQILAAVPPSHWTHAFKKTPEELIAMGRKTEHYEALIRGWARAARRHGDAEWAEALLQPAYSEIAGVEALAEALPPQRLDTLALALIRASGGKLTRDSRVVTLLSRHRSPWSHALSRAFLDSLRERARQSDTNQHVDWQLRSLLNQFALSIPPELADEAAAGWPEDEARWAWWKPSVESFLSILQLRHDMLKEIRT